jgi:hypothetical protein
MDDMANSTGERYFTGRWVIFFMDLAVRPERQDEKMPMAQARPKRPPLADVLKCSGDPDAQDDGILRAHVLDPLPRQRTAEDGDDVFQIRQLRHACGPYVKLPQGGLSSRRELC